jgi:hypothetical protein
MNQSITERYFSLSEFVGLNVSENNANLKNFDVLQLYRKLHMQYFPTLPLPTTIKDSDRWLLKAAYYLEKYKHSNERMDYIEAAMAVGYHTQESQSKEWEEIRMMKN